MATEKKLKYELKPYDGERFSLGQWYEECFNKFGFAVELQVRKLVGDQIMSSQKIYFDKKDKWGQAALMEMDPNEKLTLYFDDKSKEIVTKSQFLRMANDGNTIPPHHIVIDHDFDHEGIDFKDQNNQLFKVFKQLDEVNLEYFTVATVKGRGTKIVFQFKDLLSLPARELEKGRKNIGEYIKSLVGGELKLTGDQCSPCYPAKEGEEPIHAKTGRPLKIVHFTGFDNPLKKIQERIEKEKAATATGATGGTGTAIGNKEDKIKEEYERIRENIFELWTDEHGNPYATIINKKHKENWAIYSRRFKNFITKVFYEELEEVPNSQQIKTFQDIFAAGAQFDGSQYDTHLRCAKLGDSLYIDLCKDDWRILEITKNKIEEGESDIKFKRFNHMKELKYDLEVSELDLDLIFKYINIENEKDRLLFKIDCVLQPIANIPRVIDNFHGSAGSGKTIAFKCKRKLIDPSSMETLSLSKDKTELIQKLSHHYMCYFDNVRRISQEYSDIFCRTTTGDAFSKRELYTDDEDIIYKLKRKLGFNGINVVGEEPDFLDRSVTYELLRIPKKERKKEEDMLKEFEQDQPKITGAIFKILQKALSKVEEIKLEELPRMADYCSWGEAVAQVLGENEKVFTIAYFEKIGNLSKEALETNPVGLCLLEFMNENDSFEGTASELLERLKEEADKLKIDTRNYFPKAPNTLTRRINDIKANLEEEGLKIEYDTTGKRRLIRIYPKKSVETASIVEESKLREEEQRFKGIEKDDIADGIKKERNNGVETSTIKTIKDGLSKNKNMGESPRENKEKNNDFNNIHDISIEEIKIDFSKSGVKEELDDG